METPLSVLSDKESEFDLGEPCLLHALRQNKDVLIDTLDSISGELSSEISSQAAPFWSLLSSISDVLGELDACMEKTLHLDLEAVNQLEIYGRLLEETALRKEKIALKREQQRYGLEIRKTLLLRQEVASLLAENNFEGALQSAKKAKEEASYLHGRTHKALLAEIDEMKRAIGKAIRDHYSEGLAAELRLSGQE